MVSTANPPPPSSALPTAAASGAFLANAALQPLPLGALPPVRRSDGHYPNDTRTPWLSPLSFERGIARATFLHEALPAVQSCPTAPWTPIGWHSRLLEVVDREVRGILTTATHQADRILALRQRYLLP